MNKGDKKQYKPKSVNEDKLKQYLNKQDGRQYDRLGSRGDKQ